MITKQMCLALLALKSLLLYHTNELTLLIKFSQGKGGTGWYRWWKKSRETRREGEEKKKIRKIFVRLDSVK